MKNPNTVPKISIIIPTIGEARKEKLNNLLSEIEKQTFTSREVLVIEGENRQGRAINKAAARARGEILIILDDDTSLGHTDLFKNLVNTLESDMSIGMVGASTIPKPDDSLFQKTALRQVPRKYYPIVDKITESDMAQHGCCAIAKRIFEEVGGENEILVRGLDPELRFRIRERGYKIVIAPHAWIHHPLPESIHGIFKMYFKNGKEAAFAYKMNPGLIYEVADMFHKFPLPQKTNLSYRVFRFIKRLIWNIITFRMIALVSMIGYGLGYIIGFFTYRKPEDSITFEHFLYNIKYLLRTIKEISSIFVKEILINRKRLFKYYLKDRLVLYSVNKLRVKHISKTILWIHGNTLGEMNAAIKLSKILKGKFSDISIIASTTELATYSMTKDIVQEINEVLFLPFDIPFLIHRVFKRLRPKLFITVEQILWPNIIMELNSFGITIMLLNGYSGYRLCEIAARYMIPKKLLRLFLNKIDFLGMRSSSAARDLIELGVDKKRIEISGWLKLDLPVDFPREEEKNKLLEGLYLGKDIDIIIAGSTWSGEEEIFLKAFKEVIRTHTNLIMIIAPRHMDRIEEVCDLVLKIGMTPKKKSLLGIERAKNGNVIILDTLGELYKLYGIAKLSFPGGSFIELPGGGNIAEPLLRGSPVIIGPYTSLWDNLIKEMNLKRVRDYSELRDAVRYFLDNVDEAIRSRDFALRIIDKHRGSFEKCIEAIERMIF